MMMVWVFYYFQRSTFIYYWTDSTMHRYLPCPFGMRLRRWRWRWWWRTHVMPTHHDPINGSLGWGGSFWMVTVPCEPIISFLPFFWPPLQKEGIYILSMIFLGGEVAKFQELGDFLDFDVMHSAQLPNCFSLSLVSFSIWQSDGDSTWGPLFSSPMFFLVFISLFNKVGLLIQPTVF